MLNLFRLIFVLFVFISVVSYGGENQKIKDSLNLLRLNPNIHDTTYIKYSYELAKYYMRQSDSIILIMNESLELAKNIKYKKGCYFGYVSLSSIYKDQKEYEKALYFINKAFKFTENQRDYYKVLDKKADIYFFSKENELVIETYHTIIKLTEEDKDLEQKSHYLNKLANFYYQTGNIGACIENLEKAIKIVSDTSIGIITSYNNLGYIYQQQNDFESALSVFTKGLSLTKKHNQKHSESEIYINISSIYKKKAEIEKGKTKDSLLFLSIDNLLLAKEIKEIKENKSNRIENVYSNLGYVYVELNQLSKAHYYNLKALEIRELNKDKQGLSNSYWNLGRMNYKLDKLDSALFYLRKSYKMGNEMGNLELEKKTSGLLSIVYEKLDLIQLALKMSRVHEQTKDSLVNKGTQKAMLSQQLKYKYEKEKLKNDAENKINLTKEKEAKERQKIISYSIGIGLFLTAFFLLHTYQRLQVTKKQKGIIELQKKEVEQQKEIIEETHKEITDSINYAKRLQSSILPAITEIEENFSNSFVLFNPKDVVSGDFYWFENINKIKYIAVADCTGHGVPGALVSIVCAAALNRSVKEFRLTEPNEILNKSREIIIETFSKNNKEIKDGMDISLCKIEGNKLIFSGANNPLWIVRELKYLTEVQKQDRKTIVIDNLTLIEIPANRQSVGLSFTMDSFRQQEITLIKGDRIYLFTDGYADQFGGEKGKKLKSKRLKEILISISDKSMLEQKEYLLTTFDNWRGQQEQIDDVCIVGVEV